MKNKWISILGMSMLILLLTACSDSKSNGDAPNEDNTTNDSHNLTENNTNENESNTTPENDKNDTNDLTENNNAEQQENTNENSNDNNDDTSNDTGDNSDDDPTITALVNKEHSLEDNYAPDDLVTVDVPTVLENPEVNQLREVAADALKEMFDEAKESGIYLHARSGYRSYETQVQLFQNYVEQHGEEAANRYSAKPGQSEHQTGLVMDVTSESMDFQLDESFDETEEGKWLRDHAHEYGFIIRYPKDGEDMTGYMYEPWHIRYLGVDMATNVYESGLTYEQYLEEEGLIDEINS